MSSLYYQTYEILKTKLGQKEAGIVVEYFKAEIQEKMENNNKHISSKADLMEVKIELLEKIMSVEAKLTKTIFVSGLIQYLAIIGSILAILNFMLKR